jgi:hypothetical protein
MSEEKKFNINNNRRYFLATLSGEEYFAIITEDVI